MPKPADIATAALRIGAVNYLNSKPLVYGLQERLPHCPLRFDLPSRLADSLKAERLDVALIPSVEVLREPGFRIVSNACVASHGPVQSVKLYFRKPPDEVESLALDEGSRTSATLAQVLLAERHGVRPELKRLPIGCGSRDVQADAVLLIGDRAMFPATEPFVEEWDLASEWKTWTGLPFVFACWASRRGVDAEPVVEALNTARDAGVAATQEIAAEQAPLLQVDQDFATRYLKDHLHFKIGNREQRSLQLFAQHCEKLGLIGKTEQAAGPPRPPIRPSTDPVQSILDKAVAGERITPAEGLRLLQSNDLASIGRAADEVTRRKHPESYRTYNIDRNVNYTNVCTAICDFCAFYRKPKDEDAYVLPLEEILQKTKETVELGGDQLLLQGGLHPKYKLEWYEEMLRGIKAAYPQVNIHGFSPPEIHHFTKVNRLPLREVLTRLKEAGLGSLPGGGAEILVDRVRNTITRGKVLSDDWLNVMRVWHQLGGVSSATMMFGHVETLAERMEHLNRLRELQDESLAYGQEHNTDGKFSAFICWTFQPDNTEMADTPRRGAHEYLKTNAVARLFLDNFDNLQSSWVTQGLKVGQMALLYGANDMGSLMIEENVVAEAGTVHYLSLEQIRDAITEIGYEPRQRDVFYDLIDGEDEFRPSDAPSEESRLPRLPVIS